MTSVMSTTGEPEYGQSAPAACALLTRAPATDRDSYVQGSIEGLRMWGSPELIPGARFELIEGMGHDYPAQLWKRWTKLVSEFAHANPGHS